MEPFLQDLPSVVPDFMKEPPDYRNTNIIGLVLNVQSLLQSLFAALGTTVHRHLPSAFDLDLDL